MRVFCLTAFLLASCIGCSEKSQGVVADKDELAAYVAENPSLTTEEVMASMSGADEDAE